MPFAESIVVVLGPWRGGTSAVAGVLRHLGVFMGTEFDWIPYTPHETWEDVRISHLFRRAINEQTGQFQMDTGSFDAKLRSWATEHRRAARIAGCRPGVKHPLLCLAVDHIRGAWGPMVPIVVERPLADVVASLNRHQWFRDEQERVEVTARLIAARDRALADAATVRVDFEEFRAAPAAAIPRLADQLCLDVTDAQVQAAAESVLQPDDVRLGAHEDPGKHIRDRMLAEVQRNPENRQAVLRLARAYFYLGDFVNACKWYARRAEMGGWEEEIYIAKLEVARSMERLGAPWPDVQDAFLKAWEFRPTRAEPPHAIAKRYREEQRYRLGYQFARLAAEIPDPEKDVLFVPPDIYDAWRATDEQAICAAGIGKHAEAFALCRRLLALPDIPDDDRQRIAGNRDMCVPMLIDAGSPYPNELVERLLAGPGEAEVVVSLVAGPDRESTEQTLNSFLNCCADVARVGRFLVVDAGLSARDRAMLQQRYGFLAFARRGLLEEVRRPGAELADLRAQIDGRFWLHLGQGWRFFAPENVVTRLVAVLEAEPEVFQVGVNFTDAVKAIGACAAEEAVRRAPDAGRYVLTDALAGGPAMFDTARLDRAGGVQGTDVDPLAALGRRAPAAGLRTASLDEVLCIAAA